MLLWYW